MGVGSEWYFNPRVPLGPTKLGHRSIQRSWELETVTHQLMPHGFSGWCLFNPFTLHQDRNAPWLLHTVARYPWPTLLICDNV
ncbi:hypothetical protein KQX54_007289 [Cotesia glomerata]|uniref:Uncharacterized protein n=1 Tax=Cotesia glomerata TaxID=32391 RepID=A0AAV7HQ03_COTGL|nr:hypothetical protein KQX54_007289 [Cotesia glomerata]